MLSALGRYRVVKASRGTLIGVGGCVAQQEKQRLLEQVPYAAPLARLGKVRSAGISDLRHGSLLDEDWEGHNRFARRSDPRRPVPLPEGVRCRAIAGTTGSADNALATRVLGDGMVPVSSALGHHRNRRLTLAFPDSGQWIAYGTGHLDLLSRRAVYERLRAWLAE